jgi:hypothetical protein
VYERRTVGGGTKAQIEESDSQLGPCRLMYESPIGALPECRIFWLDPGKACAAMGAGLCRGSHGSLEWSCLQCMYQHAIPTSITRSRSPVDTSLPNGSWREGVLTIPLFHSLQNDFIVSAVHQPFDIASILQALQEMPGSSRCMPTSVRRSSDACANCVRVEVAVDFIITPGIIKGRCHA